MESQKPKPKICSICDEGQETLKRCKICEFMVCDNCSQIIGGFFGLLGKRYCTKCIVIMCESSNDSNKGSTVKSVIKNQEEEIGKYSESKLSNPISLSRSKCFPKLEKNESTDEQMTIAIEISKKEYEAELKRKKKEEEEIFAKIKLVGAYPKLDDDKEDEQLKRALELSRITFESEKFSRERGLNELDFGRLDIGQKYYNVEDFSQQKKVEENYAKANQYVMFDNNDPEIDPDSYLGLIDSMSQQSNPNLPLPSYQDLLASNHSYSPSNPVVYSDPSLSSNKCNPLNKPDLYSNLIPSNHIYVPPPPPVVYSNPILPSNKCNPSAKPEVHSNLKENSIIKSNQSEIPQIHPVPSSHSRPQEVQIFETDPKLEYSLVKKLASGSMGTIYIGKNLSTNEHIAIKIIETQSKVEQDLIINEVTLTINSFHKHIITYYKCYHFENSFWIIEELMACSLADLILDMPERIPEKIISYILKPILEAIHFLHSNNRLHRDIKSDNVLLSLNSEIKLGDLGFAAQLDDKNQNRNTFAGTLLWMSPELLNQSSYTYKTDIWSLGIVAYELAEGEPPYYKEGQQRIVVNILNQNAPRLRDEKKWSSEFVDFIGKCLIKIPEFRAETSELLNHPFITKCDVGEEEFRAFFNNWMDNR